MSELPPGATMIACAPNGARRVKSDHPALPISTREIAEAARDAHHAGACLLHLHVRDESGAHSLDPARYRDAIAATRAAAGHDLIIQITTESAGVFDIEAQMRAVRESRPEAASCALRELCPHDDDRAPYAAFLAECRDAGAWVQHILYNETDVARFFALRREGIIAEPRPFVLLVFGRDLLEPGAAPTAFIQRATPFVADDSCVWMSCAFGAIEPRLTLASVALGGHARIGFENNLNAADGAPARSNAAQIADFAAALAHAGLQPAQARDVRAAYMNR